MYLGIEPQFIEPKTMQILIPPIPLDPVDVGYLSIYGFSPYLYGEVIMNHITVGYDESLFNIVACECDELNLPENLTASITDAMERVGRTMLNHILQRQSLHFLLVSDIIEVTVDDLGNWLVRCAISESKYEIAKQHSQYSILLPNMQYSNAPSYC